MRRLIASLTAVATAAFMLAAAAPAAAQTEVTLWTHWAAEKIKRDFVEDAIRRFEEKNPGVKIKASWYEKTALYAALKTALRAGQAPDIFYAEPDQVEYMENGFLLDLSDAQLAEHRALGEGGLELQGQALRLPARGFDRRALLQQEDGRRARGEDSGRACSSRPTPSSTSSEERKAKGWTPMSLGVGDRPFPGAYLTHEALLKKLGTDDYDKLLKGKLPWSDPRVVDTLKWLRTLIDAGLLPTSFTSLKLGEAHTYFHTNPGAVMFLNGSWYTSRAFNPPDKGGQPKDFPLGVMKFPAVPGAACNDCRTLSVQGSYVANADTKRKKEVLAFFNSMASRRLATAGSRTCWCRPASRATSRKSPGRTPSISSLLAATNKDAKYYFGAPSPGHAGQGQGGVHAGDQQCLPGRHHRSRGRGEAARGIVLSSTHVVPEAAQRLSGTQRRAVGPGSPLRFGRDDARSSE